MPIALAFALVFGVAPLTDAPGTRDAAAAPMLENNKVRVNDEEEFAERIREAEMEGAAGRYDRALRIYESLLADADRWETDPPGGSGRATLTVPVETTMSNREAGSAQGEPNEPMAVTILYRPLRDVVLERIWELPGDARRPYLDSIRVVAGQALTEALAARNRARIQEVADRFWMSSSGPAALDIAGSLAFEAGDFLVASHYFEKLWERDEVLFFEDFTRLMRLAGCYDMAGDTWSLSDLYRRARRRVEGLTIRLGAERVRIDELILGSIARSYPVDHPRHAHEGAALSSYLPIAQTAKSPAGWPMPGGQPARGRTMPSFTEFTDRTWTKNLADVFGADGNDPRMGMYGMPMQTGRNIAIAAEDGRVVVTGPTSGLIINLPESPTARSLSVVPIQAKQFLPSDSTPNNGGGYWYGYYQAESSYYMPAIENGRMYAFFHSTDQRGRAMGAVGQQVIGAFDLAAEGKILWYAPRNEIDPDNAEFMRQMNFGTSPLPINGDVLMAGKRNVEGEHRYYVICLDGSQQGRVRWITKLGSYQTSTMNWRGPADMPSEVMPLAASGGMVFTGTNSGALAGIDALTGRLRWVMKYTRPNMYADMNAFRYGQVQTVRQWNNDPPVVAHGALFATPVDSNRVMVLGARTGTLLRMIPDAGTNSDDYLYLMGVSANQLVVQGRSKVHWLDIRQYFLNDFVLNQDAVTSLPFGQGHGTDANTVLGRGIITEQLTYVPTKRGLVPFDNVTGKLQDTIPWPHDMMAVAHASCYVVEARRPDADGNVATCKYVVVLADDNLIVMEAE